MTVNHGVFKRLKTLGVEPTPNLSLDTIKKSFRQSSLQTHPDNPLNKGREGDQNDKAEAKNYFVEFLKVESNWPNYLQCYSETTKSFASALREAIDFGYSQEKLKYHLSSQKLKKEWAMTLVSVNKAITNNAHCQSSFHLDTDDGSIQVKNLLTDHIDSVYDIVQIGHFRQKLHDIVATHFPGDHVHILGNEAVLGAGFDAHGLF